MSYVTREQIERAKQMDLLTYLKSFEPQELVHFSGNVYTTRTYDSLKISNGKWYWWSRGIGGRSALDYLIKVRGMTFPEAVILLDGQAVIVPPALSHKPVLDESKKLQLPERNGNNDRVIAYLTNRGIYRSLIDYCIRTGRLYESREYHNAVFVGFDRVGIPRYGMLRGTSGRRFLGEITGSDKRYSFSIQPRLESSKLHLFESAIDLLSYGTLELLSGKDWRQDHYLSLAGVYKPGRNEVESTLPAALMQYLKDYPKIKEIALHLDNDEPGRIAAKAIQVHLSSAHEVSNEPPERGKDVNDFLMRVLKIWHQYEPER